MKQHFHIHGSRRTGKTSLLRTIEHTINLQDVRRYFRVAPELDPVLNNTHAAYFSLEELPETSGKHLDAKVFVRELLLRIGASLDMSAQERAQLQSEIDLDLRRSHYAKAILRKNLLSMLASFTPGERLLILIDELDVLQEEEDRRLLGQLRSLITDPSLSRIMWVVVTTHGLLEGWGSPLHGLFETIVLGSIDADEARRQILQPARQAGIYFSSDAIEYILEQTGRYPYFIQIVCNCIAEQLKSRRKAHVSREFAEEVVFSIYNSKDMKSVQDLYDHCRHQWERLSGESMLLLAFLAQHAEGSPHARSFAVFAPDHYAEVRDCPP